MTDAQARSGKMGPIVPLVVLAVVTGLVWFLWRTFSTPEIGPSIAWTDESQRTELVGRDTTGAELWKYQLPASAASYRAMRDWGGEDQPAPGEGVGHRLLDLIKRGNPRVGRIYFTEFENPQIPDRIVAFDYDKGVRWETTYPEAIGPVARRLQGGWTLKDDIQFSVAGTRRTVLLFRRANDWPSVIVVLDDSGKVAGRFVHAGPLERLRFESLSRYPDAWTDFILVAEGSSASRNAPVLVVLDADRVAGRSPEDAGSSYDCAECKPPGAALRYFVFPRSELETAMDSPPAELRYEHGSSLDGVAADRFTTREPSGTEYIFSADYRQLLRTYLTEDHWNRHAQLESEGRIKHSRDNCPARPGPASVRAWDAAKKWHDLKASSHVVPM